LDNPHPPRTASCYARSKTASDCSGARFGHPPPSSFFLFAIRPVIAGPFCQRRRKAGATCLVRCSLPVSVITGFGLSPRNAGQSHMRSWIGFLIPPRRGGWHRRPSAAVLGAKNADAKRRLCERSEAGRVGFLLSAKRSKLCPHPGSLRSPTLPR